MKCLLTKNEFNFTSRVLVVADARGNPALAESVQGVGLGASQFFNGMEGETYGVELAANWRLTGWWRLQGTYTLLKTNMHIDPADLAALLPAQTPAQAVSAKGQEAAVEGNSPQQLVYLQSSWNLPWDVEFDLIGRWVDRLHGFNPGGLPGVSDTVEQYVTLDARLAWRAGTHVEFSVVGQNLLDNHHPEFGTNPFVRSPLTEIRRGVYGQVTFTW